MQNSPISVIWRWTVELTWLILSGVTIIMHIEFWAENKYKLLHFFL